METINLLKEMKEMAGQNIIKDLIFREGNKGLLSLVESDIAKMAVREFENSQGALTFLGDENQTLKDKIRSQ